MIETPGISLDKRFEAGSPMAWRPVSAVAAVAAAVHLSVATRFGWHRDEFYYVICGRHLAWGYVDQPPLTPLLARMAAASGGLLLLRLLSIATQAGCVLLTAFLAAQFGGRRRAQVIAAAATAACPVFVGASLLFGTSVLDQLAWITVTVLVVRALRLGTTRAWSAVGVAAGIGLENKDTIAGLLLGIVVGLILFRRDALRIPGPWLAGAVAFLIAVPNLLWDAQHGWANLRMARVLADKQGGTLGSLANLPLLALLLAGPPLIALWLAGVRRLASSSAPEHRWLLAAIVVAVLVLTASGGKPYYPAPALAALFAVGAVGVEELGRRRGRLLWPAAIGLSALMAWPLALPVLPVSAAVSLRKIDPDVMETYGWPSFVTQVEHAAELLPPDTPVFTNNYGEAGALTLLGPGMGLHRPVYSAHNAYGTWGPPPGTPDTVLCVGQFDAEYLRQSWSQVTPVASISLPHGLADQEVDNHAAIFVCQRPRGSWAQLWPGLRHLD